MCLKCILILINVLSYNIIINEGGFKLKLNFKKILEGILNRYKLVASITFISCAIVLYKFGEIPILREFFAVVAAAAIIFFLYMVSKED